MTILYNEDNITIQLKNKSDNTDFIRFKCSYSFEPHFNNENNNNSRHNVLVPGSFIFYIKYFFFLI